MPRSVYLISVNRSRWPTRDDDGEYSVGQGEDPRRILAPFLPERPPNKGDLVIFPHGRGLAHQASGAVPVRAGRTEVLVIHGQRRR